MLNKHRFRRSGNLRSNNTYYFKSGDFKTQGVSHSGYGFYLVFLAIRLELQHYVSCSLQKLIKHLRTFAWNFLSKNWRLRSYNYFFSVNSFHPNIFSSFFLYTYYVYIPFYYINSKLICLTYASSPSPRSELFLFWNKMTQVSDHHPFVSTVDY